MDIDLEFELMKLVSRYKTRLPESDIENIEVLATHDEWGIAFETFCTQVYEYDLTISRADYDLLEKLGRYMKLDSSYWTDLAIDS